MGAPSSSLADFLRSSCVNTENVTKYTPRRVSRKISCFGSNEGTQNPLGDGKQGSNQAVPARPLLPVLADSHEKLTARQGIQRPFRRPGITARGARGIIFSSYHPQLTSLDKTNENHIEKKFQPLILPRKGFSYEKRYDFVNREERKQYNNLIQRMYNENRTKLSCLEKTVFSTCLKKIIKQIDLLHKQDCFKKRLNKQVC